MRLVPDGESWRVEGPGSDRARVAYARLEDGCVVYELNGVRRDSGNGVPCVSGNGVRRDSGRARL
jgi:hypothetical protein